MLLSTKAKLKKKKKKSKKPRCVIIGGGVLSGLSIGIDLIIRLLNEEWAVLTLEPTSLIPTMSDFNNCLNTFRKLR